VSRRAGNDRIYPREEVVARALTHAHAPVLTHTCPRVWVHGLCAPLRVRVKTRPCQVENSTARWADQTLFMALDFFCAGNSS
jgi:hypothetical protein